MRACSKLKCLFSQGAGNFDYDESGVGHNEGKEVGNVRSQVRLLALTPQERTPRAFELRSTSFLSLGFLPSLMAHPLPGSRTSLLQVGSPEECAFPSVFLHTLQQWSSSLLLSKNIPQSVELHF